jgi:hypothetical protein
MSTPVVARTGFRAVVEGGEGVFVGLDGVVGGEVRGTVVGGASVVVVVLVVVVVGGGDAGSS